MILAFVQVFILNHIHLGGYVNAYFYLWFLLKMNRYTSRTELMLWGFCLGLTIDLFADPPGMNAAAATLVAFLRPTILSWFTKRDLFDDFEPSARSMGIIPYFSYALYLILIHHAVLLSLDMFTITGSWLLLLNILLSTLFTLFFVIVFEFLRKK